MVSGILQWSDRFSISFSCALIGCIVKPSVIGSGSNEAGNIARTSQLETLKMQTLQWNPERWKSNRFKRQCVFISVQVCSMRESSECQVLRWKSMTSRMPLREVRTNPANLSILDKLSLSSALISFLYHSLFSLSTCPYAGEDPLAGEQNDHDMDSIAGVLKLYFRGLDHALFPKEVFHDLISCVCKSIVLLYVCVSL